MSAQDLEQLARELLAAEYERGLLYDTAERIRRHDPLPAGWQDDCIAIRAIIAALRQQPAPVVDSGNWIADDAKLRDWSLRMAEKENGQITTAGAHGIEDRPAPVVDDARMARALEWVQVMAMQDADGSHVPAIQEAIAAYDPNCGARTVRGVDDAMRALAANLVDEVDGLIGESGGVYGLHLNGDPSPWDELLPGGRFERLTSLDNLRAALARAQGVQS